MKKYYIKGNLILIEKEKDILIKMRPYSIYAINSYSKKILKALLKNSNFIDLCNFLGVKNEISKLNIIQFLEQGIETGILTNNENDKGYLKCKSVTTSPHLERVFLEITSACNLNCKHCYMSSTYKKKLIDEIRVNKIKEIINEADNIGVFRFDLTGGEIFTRTDIYNILAEVRNKFMITNLFTNATLLDEKGIDTIANLGNIRTIYISLDDYIEEEHDAFRGVEGAFKKTVSNIRELKKRGLHIVANIIVSRSNIERLKYIIKFCHEELGIDCRTAPILPIGRGKSFTENDLTLEEIKYAMSVSLESQCDFVSGLCSENSRIDIIPGCGVGHKMIYIRSNGEICLCPTLSSRENPLFKLGSIYEDSLLDIWNESKILKEFRESNCEHVNCDHREIYRGGCRSRAYLTSGKMDGRDPILCHYFGIENSDMRREL